MFTTTSDARRGCSNPLAVSGGNYARLDLTGATSNCIFDVTGDTAGTYAADGTSSAFAVYAAAHPEQTVASVIVVADQPGDYELDRIAFGTNRIYNYSPYKAVDCQLSEWRC